MDEILDIRHFLSRFLDRHIIYIPNPGNAGDSIIVYGTMQLFNELQLDWEMGDINKKYENELLFYAGGGNLVGIYKDAYNFLLKNKDNNEIVILPHTIKDEDDLIRSFGKNITVFCREIPSYNYVKELHPFKDNVFLSKDMAFYINLPTELKNIEGNGTANCFRQDSESTRKHIISSDNNDISSTLVINGNTSDSQLIDKVSMSFFDYISKFKVIKTDRLHIAIASALLGKTVNLHSNSYYKIKSIFEYSMKDTFPNVHFTD